MRQRRCEPKQRTSPTTKTWCERHGFDPMPATPEVVGAYLAAAGERYALPTLRRRVAAIARACGVAGHPLDTKHPAIRETLRGIARKHGAPARRSAALTTAEIKNLTRACGNDLAGARDRALFLVSFAGALRRSELVALDVDHVTWTNPGMKLLIERSKIDAEGEGAEIAIPRGQSPETCPVAALEQWLTAAEVWPARCSARSTAVALSRPPAWCRTRSAKSCSSVLPRLD
jgi:integrase